MERAREGSELPDAARATDAQVKAALDHWERLDERSLATLAEHPEHGRSLRRLQAAEAWLYEPRPHPSDGCPSSEELFDFGRGPGARPLSIEAREQLETHVASCADCGGFAASLASPPPLPLETQPSAESEPAAQDPPPSLDAARRRRSLARWALPAAAAAALLWLMPRVWQTEAAPSGLPTAPLLRGEDPGALRFPRGATLHITAAAGWHGLRPGTTPRFELLPPPGSTAVRVELVQHDGGAFSSGEAVTTLERELEPADGAPVALAGPALETGSYTWRAWATVNGLERELGARDFEVVRDAELEGFLEGLESLSEPKRTVAAVRLLHDAGFLSAARELARAMPPSAERDAYLESTPGR